MDAPINRKLFGLSLTLLILGLGLGLSMVGVGLAHSSASVRQPPLLERNDGEKVALAVHPSGPDLIQAPAGGPPVLRPATPDEAIVFAALDLKRPELSAVALAVEAGNYPAASHAWAIYLRGRKGPHWEGTDAPPPETYNKQVSEDALVGKIQGGTVPLVYAFPDGKIDWFYNATQHTPGQTPNNEWQFQINRMGFWPEMARAYAVTGDERYPQAFARQLRSWIDQCPVPSTVRNTPDSTWRTIEAGIRMGSSWPASFFRFLPSPSLTDDDIMGYTRSVYDHATYLRKFPTAVNWLLMEMNGLVTTGCFFPEFNDAAEWRAFAFSKLTEEAKRQILPDGAQYEISTGYHYDVVIPNFLGARNVAVQTGREQELPASYIPMIERAFDWCLFLTTPDRGRPLINDSWSGTIDHTMKLALPLFPDRDDFRWFATKGMEGKPPAKTSVFLDWSGLAVMRSSWATDANYLLFRNGPMGYGGHMGEGHSHQDKLNVVVWAYGRQSLFSTSGGSYVWDKWRAWSRSSFAANCVVVDGLSQWRGTNDDTNQEHSPNRVSQQPIDAGWMSNPSFDYATGIYDEEYGTYGYDAPGLWDTKTTPKQRRKIAVQRRSVLFLKPDLYIVADTLTPLDVKEHTYQARWNLMTTHTERDAKTLSVTMADEGQPSLAIVPLLTQGLSMKAVSGQETPELLGWNCRKDIIPQNVPTTEIVHSRSGIGIQRFLTLLLPLRSGKKNPVVTVDPGQNGVKATFADGRSFRISTSDSGGIEVLESLPDGKPGRSAKAGEF